ncbi:hypothetical protein C1H46_037041 [Malus baccata]|uniref:DUF7815 domain-containing protein n=1 Tax=Malus baccata TaxID=106549 RepID=A0A540KT77_MALBA|nr:hypothetical protein C1H46_037041 [Malus baccata]
MAMEIPMDVIKQVQISLRKEAELSLYDPDDTPLPNLPSVKETLAELDPSPPYLRCEHCKGRLLRGVQTLTCVFCGREHCKDLPPDPINFRDTFGYRWLLQYLSLSGSEIVDLPVGANELNRAQTARKDELSLSDLLNLEIKWTSKPEKIETDLPNEIPNLLKLPDLAGVNLDNFFFEERKMVLRVIPKSSSGLAHRLSTTEGESGDSGWAASFQFAASESQASGNLPQASGNLPQASETLPLASEILPRASESLPQASESLPQESKSLDPFVGSTVDFSARIGTVFGSVVDSTNEKSNHSVTGSASMSSDWFQDDLLGVSNSGFSGGPERLEILAEVKGGIAENVNNSFPDGVDWVQDNQLQITSNKDLDGKTTVENDDSFDAWNDFTSSSNAPNLVDSSVKQSVVDWVQDNQLQTTSNKALDNKTTDADGDSFDAWNDFASSKNASNLADNSVKQSINQTAAVDHTSEINLFGTSSSGDLDFGSFLQPDFSAGAFNSSTVQLNWTECSQSLLY